MQDGVKRFLAAHSVFSHLHVRGLWGYSNNPPNLFKTCRFTSLHVKDGRWGAYGRLSAGKWSVGTVAGALATADSRVQRVVIYVWGGSGGVVGVSSH